MHIICLFGMQTKVMQTKVMHTKSIEKHDILDHVRHKETSTTNNTDCET